MKKILILLFGLLIYGTVFAQFPDTEEVPGNLRVIGTVKVDTIFTTGTDNLTIDDTLLVTGIVGIGTSAPSAGLDLVGTFQYVDGNESSNFVMVSDASGNVTWTDPNTIGIVTIYISDGSLTGDRTLTQGTNDLNFVGTSGKTKIESTDNHPFIIYKPVNNVGFGVGQFFNLNNSINSETTYGAITTGITSNSNGAERGFLTIQTAFGGASMDGFGPQAARFSVDAAGPHIAVGQNGAVATIDIKGFDNGTTNFAFRAGGDGNENTYVVWNNKRASYNKGTNPSATLEIIGEGATPSTFGLKIQNSTGANNALVVRDDGNVGIGTTSFGTNAATVLSILNGTAPTTDIADGIQIFSKDATVGDAQATLGLFTEQAVQVIGTFTPSHKLAIFINGVEYHIQLDSVP